jgi:hypothetical protein
MKALLLIIGTACIAIAVVSFNQYEFVGFALGSFGGMLCLTMFNKYNGKGK